MKRKQEQIKFLLFFCIKIIKYKLQITLYNIITRLYKKNLHNYNKKIINILLNVIDNILISKIN